MFKRKSVFHFYSLFQREQLEFETRIDPPPSLTEFLFTFLFCPRESERRWEKVKIYGKRLCGRSRVKNLKAFLGHTLLLSSNGKHFSKKSVFVSIKSGPSLFDAVNMSKFYQTINLSIFGLKFSMVYNDKFNIMTRNVYYWNPYTKDEQICIPLTRNT